MRTYHLTESELSLAANITTEEFWAIYQASESLYQTSHVTAPTGAQGIAREPSGGGEGVVEGAFKMDMGETEI